MANTPEQEAAQEALQAAVKAHVDAFRDGEGPPMMIADWVLVANLVAFGDDGERMTSYHIAYSDGQMDDHRAAGLFRIGERIVFGDGMVSA